MYIKDDSILRAFQNNAEMRKAVKLIENFKDLNALQKAIDYLTFIREISQAQSIINRQKEEYLAKIQAELNGANDDRTKS